MTTALLIAAPFAALWLAVLTLYLVRNRTTRKDRLMADFAALRAAVDANTTATAENTTAIQNVIARLPSPQDQATIDAATAQLNTNTAKIRTDDASIPAP